MKHLMACAAIWSSVPEQEWVHMFVHTLDTVPKNWYTALELRCGTSNLKEMTDKFQATFSFESEHPTVDAALRIIKENILMEVL